MPRVIVRKANYDEDTLTPLFGEMMTAIGGDRIQRGSRILIKPNLLSPAFPEQALLTHPAVVRAAVAYVLRMGAKPVVADSPAIGSFEKILRDGGIRKSLQGMDVEIRPFRESVKADVGAPFGDIEMAADALGADFIINLPKLKTHGQMLLTLGVKNMFGCIVGFRKPEWHVRAGVDRDMFARLLVQICRRIKPAFTILDGVLAMEGEGPGKSGAPRPLGILIGGDDPFAVDAAVCRMIGLDPRKLPTLKAAMAIGLTGEEPEIDGSLPFVADFKLPDTAPLVYGPRKLQGFIRRHIVQRPVPDVSVCTLCGECGKFCPAHAISRQGKTLRFDYDRCIRCYCCIEICPRGALHAVETLPGRLIRRAVARFR
jgi:uncharacterized protein (DUF362 family)/Pyruvate/2-oxoacid:ferredoxin oxidoreductase delta subunit